MLKKQFIFLFSLLIFACSAVMSQVPKTWQPQPFWYKYRGLISDSASRMPVLNMWYAPYTNQDSAGLIWWYPAQNSFAGKWGTTTRLFASQDYINTAAIVNQFTAPQTGNFVITGNGAASKFISYNTAGATFLRHYVLATDAIDTTKQVWSLGLSGGASSGGPIHAGGSLVFRSYTNTGAVLSDALALGRTGNLTLTGSLNTNGAIATVAGISAGSGIQAGNGISYTGGLLENTTVTVTGDYTVLTADRYVNVNNSANCTITIPAAVAAASGQGRTLDIKKISNNSFTVTLVVAGGVQTIDGAANFVISKYNDAAKIHDNGSNWFVYTKPPSGASHFVSTGLPTFTLNGSTTSIIGTGYSINIVGSGNYFKIELTTGTGITTTGTIGQIFFATPFPSDPVTVYSQTDLNAVGTTVLFSAVDGTYILMANKTVLLPSTVYTFSVHTGLIN